MSRSQSDALVLFGVTGDLAHKMIFSGALCHGEARRAHGSGDRCRHSPSGAWTACTGELQTVLSEPAVWNDKHALKRLLVLIQICEWGLQGSSDLCGHKRCAGQSAETCALPGDSTLALCDGN